MLAASGDIHICDIIWENVHTVEVRAAERLVKKSVLVAVAFFFILDIPLCCIFYKVFTNHHQHNYLSCFIRQVVQMPANRVDASSLEGGGGW